MCLKWNTLRRYAALMLALLITCLPVAQAESTLLPPSAMILQRSQSFLTGELDIELPDATLNVIDSAQANALRDAMAQYEPPESSLLINNAEYYYFYDHLDPLAKQIYDIILQIARDPVSEMNVHVMLTPVDPDSEEFVLAYWRARWAACYDHPELFWLYPHGGEASVIPCGIPELVNGRYTVFFRMDKPYEAFESRMNAFNDASSAFLAGIDLAASKTDIVRQVHDKLIDLVIYDDATSEQGALNLAHTAYGCLVGNTAGSANYAVCDGYSLAFEYLLQQCGITATMISGEVEVGPGQWGGHAWSIVNLDGEWYEVDSTWDDSEIDETQLESIRYSPDYDLWVELFRNPDFREKHGHYRFLIASDLMEHYIAPEDVDWTFTINNGSDVVYFAPDESNRVRRSAETADKTEMQNYGRASLIDMVPRAERNYPF